MGGLPQVEVVVARATMAYCVLLLGLVGARCVMAWRKSSTIAPVWNTLGGTPGMLLFGAVASYLAIGASVLGVEAIREPDTAGFLRYHVLLLGVLAAAAAGGRAVLEEIGAERLLRGVLVILIAGCAIILASPVLRDLGILPPYRLPFRLTGAFDEPNNAGLAACMTAALAAAFLTNGGPRALGWLGLAAAASLATASRTALVVNLAGLELNGRIPSDLGRLDRLVSLSLRRNRLSGPIPPELGNLANLEHLNLSYNTLTGGIPPELAKLENLEELWLKHSRLTGVVPAALAELDLSVLRLSRNDFDSVPPELTTVADHDLDNMRLPSTSPARFDDCTLLAVKETLAGNASLN